MSRRSKSSRPTSVTIGEHEASITLPSMVQELSRWSGSETSEGSAYADLSASSPIVTPIVRRSSNKALGAGAAKRRGSKLQTVMEESRRRDRSRAGSFSRTQLSRLYTDHVRTSASSTAATDTVGDANDFELPDAPPPAPPSVGSRASGQSTPPPVPDDIALAEDLAPVPPEPSPPPPTTPTPPLETVISVDLKSLLGTDTSSADVNDAFDEKRDLLLLQRKKSAGGRSHQAKEEEEPGRRSSSTQRKSGKRKPARTTTGSSSGSAIVPPVTAVDSARAAGASATADNGGRRRSRSVLMAASSSSAREDQWNEDDGDDDGVDKENGSSPESSPSNGPSPPTVPQSPVPVKATIGASSISLRLPLTGSNNSPPTSSSSSLSPPPPTLSSSTSTTRNRSLSSLVPLSPTRRPPPSPRRAISPLSLPPPDASSALSGSSAIVLTERITRKERSRSLAPPMTDDDLRKAAIRTFVASVHSKSPRNQNDASSTSHGGGTDETVDSAASTPLLKPQQQQQQKALSPRSPRSSISMSPLNFLRRRSTHDAPSPVSSATAADEQSAAVAAADQREFALLRKDRRASGVIDRDSVTAAGGGLAKLCVVALDGSEYFKGLPLAPSDTAACVLQTLGRRTANHRWSEYAVFQQLMSGAERRLGLDEPLVDCIGRPDHVGFICRLPHHDPHLAPDIVAAETLSTADIDDAPTGAAASDAGGGGTGAHSGTGTGSGGVKTNTNAAGGGSSHGGVVDGGGAVGGVDQSRGSRRSFIATATGQYGGGPSRRRRTSLNVFNASLCERCHMARGAAHMKLNTFLSLLLCRACTIRLKERRTGVRALRSPSLLVLAPGVRKFQTFSPVAHADAAAAFAVQPPDQWIAQHNQVKAVEAASEAQLVAQLARRRKRDRDRDRDRRHLTSGPNFSSATSSSSLPATATAGTGIDAGTANAPPDIGSANASATGIGTVIVTGIGTGNGKKNNVSAAKNSTNAAAGADVVKNIVVGDPGASVVVECADGQTVCVVDVRPSWTVTRLRDAAAQLAGVAADKTFLFGLLLCRLHVGSAVDGSAKWLTALAPSRPLAQLPGGGLDTLRQGRTRLRLSVRYWLWPRAGFTGNLIATTSSSSSSPDPITNNEGNEGDESDDEDDDDDDDDDDGAARLMMAEAGELIRSRQWPVSDRVALRLASYATHCEILQQVDCPGFVTSDVDLSSVNTAGSTGSGSIKSGAIGSNSVGFGAIKSGSIGSGSVGANAGSGASDDMAKRSKTGDDAGDDDDDDDGGGGGDDGIVHGGSPADRAELCLLKKWLPGSSDGLRYHNRRLLVARSRALRAEYTDGCLPVVSRCEYLRCAQRAVPTFGVRWFTFNRGTDAPSASTSTSASASAVGAAQNISTAATADQPTATHHTAGDHNYETDGNGNTDEKTGHRGGVAVASSSSSSSSSVLSELRAEGGGKPRSNFVPLVRRGSGPLGSTASTVIPQEPHTLGVAADGIFVPLNGIGSPPIQCAYYPYGLLKSWRIERKTETTQPTSTSSSSSSATSVHSSTKVHSAAAAAVYGDEEVTLCIVFDERCRATSPELRFRVHVSALVSVAVASAAASLMDSYVRLLAVDPETMAAAQSVGLLPPPHPSKPVPRYSDHRPSTSSSHVSSSSSIVVLREPAPSLDFQLQPGSNTSNDDTAATADVDVVGGKKKQKKQKKQKQKKQQQQQQQQQKLVVQQQPQQQQLQRVPWLPVQLPRAWMDRGASRLQILRMALLSNAAAVHVRPVASVVAQLDAALASGHRLTHLKLLPDPAFNGHSISQYLDPLVAGGTASSSFRHASSHGGSSPSSSAASSARSAGGSASSNRVFNNQIIMNEMSSGISSDQWWASLDHDDDAEFIISGNNDRRRRLDRLEDSSALLTLRLLGDADFEAREFEPPNTNNMIHSKLDNARGNLASSPRNNQSSASDHQSESERGGAGAGFGGSRVFFQEDYVLTDINVSGLPLGADEAACAAVGRLAAVRTRIPTNASSSTSSKPFSPTASRGRADVPNRNHDANVPNRNHDANVPNRSHDANILTGTRHGATPSNQRGNSGGNDRDRDSVLFGGCNVLNVSKCCLGPKLAAMAAAAATVAASATSQGHSDEAVMAAVTAAIAQLSTSIVYPPSSSSTSGAGAVGSGSGGTVDHLHGSSGSLATVAAAAAMNMGAGGAGDGTGVKKSSFRGSGLFQKLTMSGGGSKVTSSSSSSSSSSNSATTAVTSSNSFTTSDVYSREAGGVGGGGGGGAAAASSIFPNLLKVSTAAAAAACRAAVTMDNGAGAGGDKASSSGGRLSRMMMTDDRAGPDGAGAGRGAVDGGKAGRGAVDGGKAGRGAVDGGRAGRGAVDGGSGGGGAGAADGREAQSRSKSARSGPISPSSSSWRSSWRLSDAGPFSSSSSRTSRRVASSKPLLTGGEPLSLVSSSTSTSATTAAVAGSGMNSNSNSMETEVARATVKAAQCGALRMLVHGLTAGAAPLQHLFVGGNGLGARGLELLAPALYAVSGQLISLSLRDNQLDGPAVRQHLCGPLARCTALCVLDVAGNRLADDGISCLFQHLPPLARADPGLTVLNVAHNQMTSRSAGPLGKFCRGHFSLRALYAAGNPKLGSGSGGSNSSLGDDLAATVRHGLAVLDVRQCGLSAKAVADVLQAAAGSATDDAASTAAAAAGNGSQSAFTPAAAAAAARSGASAGAGVSRDLFEPSPLRELLIACNQADKRTGPLLAQALGGGGGGGGGGLRTLNVSEVKLSSKSLVLLGNAMVRATAPLLRCLDLSFSAIGQDAADALARGLEQGPAVDSLTLKRCSLTSSSLVQLLTALGTRGSMRQLTLDANRSAFAGNLAQDTPTTAEAASAASTAGGESAAAVADSACMAVVRAISEPSTTLDLSSFLAAQSSALECQLLLALSKLTCLETLSVRNNLIGTRGTLLLLLVLRDSPGFTGIDVGGKKRSPALNLDLLGAARLRIKKYRGKPVCVHALAETTIAGVHDFNTKSTII